MRSLILALTLGCLCITASSYARDTRPGSDDIAPQVAATYNAKTLAKAKDFMVATANPYATEAGLAVLKAGGSAADAAIAIQLTLGLVEPQSSGLGGGALVVYWDNTQQRLVALDGRETAPKGVTAALFQDAQGQPLSFMDAVVGGKSVGTPGTLKLLDYLHQHYGKLAWADLFQAPIRLAQQGFVVSPHMAEQIASSTDSLQKFPATQQYFFDKQGQPLTAGAVRDNPDYAASLKLLAEQGAKVFYNGELGQAVVDTVQQAPINPGTLSMEDLANYVVKEREVICGFYRMYKVCGMGPPTSGNIAIAQILGMLEPFDLAKLGPTSPDSWRLIGDATRLAFADRNRYVADSDFINVPVKELLHPAYLQGRSNLLKGSNALKEINAGNPPEIQDKMGLLGNDHALELPSTSHFVVVDKAGNVISMTTTIENGFGSRLMTHGFLLNNELTDFSFVAEENGAPVANRVEPNKRPRSSMSPTIVLKDQKPVLAIGSPGGSNIIPFVTQALINYIDWGMDIQQAVAMPHLVNRTGDYYLEKDTKAESYKPMLETLGYTIKIDNLNSGLQAIALKVDGLEGGVDPRRDGVAAGQ